MSGNAKVSYVLTIAVPMLFLGGCVPDYYAGAPYYGYGATPMTGYGYGSYGYGSSVVGMAAGAMAVGMAAEMAEADAAAATPTQDTRLALRPSLPDSQNAQVEKKLSERLNAFRGSPGYFLNADAGTNCVLDEDIKWQISEQMSETEYNRIVGSSFRDSGMDFRVESIDASLLDGTCANNVPEGPFTAKSRIVWSFTNSGMTTRMIVNRHVEGTIKNGDLNGELIMTARQDSTESEENGPATSVNGFIGYFQDGEAVGTGIFIQDAQISRSTIVREQLGDNRRQDTMYFGDQLHQETFYKNGLKHGWMITHPIMMYGTTSEGSRACYQNGTEAPDTACGTPPTT